MCSARDEAASSRVARYPAGLPNDGRGGDAVCDHSLATRIDHGTNASNAAPVTPSVRIDAFRHAAKSSKLADV